MKAIADTGFLVAFANRSDRHHIRAVTIARTVAEPLLTCEAVLPETAFHLQDASLVLNLVTQGLVRPAFTLAGHLSRIAELALRYRDRNPDLSDLCLIRMSELHPNHVVVTVDRADFRVYRRNRRQIIPLHPPMRHQAAPGPACFSSPALAHSSGSPADRERHTEKIAIPLSLTPKSRWPHFADWFFDAALRCRAIPR